MTGDARPRGAGRPGRRGWTPARRSPPRPARGPSDRSQRGLVSKTRFARHDDLQIAYEMRGPRFSRRPPLLLIQGLGLDRAGWGPAIGRLQRRFRIVLVENRGSGRSPASGSFSVADMAGDAVAVLDDAGIGAAHVLGASLGGMIAQELAVRCPERVGRLILACTTPGWPFAYPMPLPSVRLMAASRRLTPDEAVRRNVENALSAATVADRPELVRRIIDGQPSLSEPDPEAWQAQAAAGGRYAGSLRQRRIRARTLILHGMADRVVDPRNARLLAVRIPQAELVTFPGLGHLFFWEDPDAFAAVVTSFLEGRDP
jgi:3-oxoadipate enol-lactonase